MLIYYKTSSTTPVAEALARTIVKHLDDGGRVIWLLSGGSAVKPAIEASELLEGHDLSRLTVSLVDERYGPLGHSGSNWQSLIDDGFKFGNSKTYPVLSGVDNHQTTKAYNKFLEESLSGPTYRLALLGIGPDGHTAGILPHSPAVNSQTLAVYYETKDYERITITTGGLARLDEAIVYCVGTNKADALAKLDQNLTLESQPAQIIKRIPQANVYNDIKGEIV